MVYIYSQTAEFRGSSSSLDSHNQSNASAASVAPADATTSYILSFYVPTSDVSKVCAKICRQSGAGSFSSGLDQEVYWTTKGVGQFRPVDGPNGNDVTGLGKVEKAEENKVEMVCVGRECAQKAVAALLKAHPYEQVPYYVVKTEQF